jgi:hypothetical protein
MAKNRNRPDKIIEMTLFARSGKLNDTNPQTYELRKLSIKEDKL